MSSLADSHLNALLDCPLFQEMEPAVFEALRDRLEIVFHLGGEQIVTEGGESDALFIVLSGRIQIVRARPDGSEEVLIELGRGQTMGEMGLVTGEPRSASAVATRDALLARLSKADFDALLQQYPQAMTRHFAAGVIVRLREQLYGTARKQVSALSVAVLPVGDAAAARAFVDLLQHALGRLGSTALIDERQIGAALGNPAIAQVPADHPDGVRVTQWLSAQEIQHRYLLLQADNLADNWTRRMVRQADRLLLVCDGDRPPTVEQLAPVRQALAARGDSRAQRILVLHHATATVLPTGTQAWLTALAPVKASYHVRRGAAADAARIARMIAGQGIGVVLSGGGARGFAHIGGLRALREVGIPVDLLGGTSMGGLMSFQHAMGWDDATLMAKNEYAAVHYHFDYTFPLVSLMAGDQVTASLQEMFGATQIEDLWLPCFCTSTDVTNDQLLIHTEGPVWKYARATTSLPGVLPPVVDGDRLLVDGGVLNNVPIDIMYAREDVGSVIVFDVGRHISEQVEQYAYETAISGWRMLGNRLNPFARKKLTAPSIASVMMRLVMLGNAQALRQARNLARFYGVLDAGDASMLDLDQCASIVASGYRSGRALAAEWRAAFTELQPGDA